MLAVYLHDEKKMVDMMITINIKVVISIMIEKESYDDFELYLSAAVIIIMKINH